MQPENMNRCENKIFLLRLSKIGCNNPLELSVGLLSMSQAKKNELKNSWDTPILGMLGTRCCENFLLLRWGAEIGIDGCSN